MSERQQVIVIESLPSSITIRAGQSTSSEFAVNAVDDTDVDGAQSVTISASGDGASDGTATLRVLDDDVLPPPHAILDLDGNGGDAAAQSDGLLVFAVLSGVTDSSQLDRLVAVDSSRTTTQIVGTVQELQVALDLDVDGDGTVRGQSDGLLMFAILSGVTNPAQLQGLMGAGATKTVPEVVAAVDALTTVPVTASASAVEAAVHARKPTSVSTFASQPVTAALATAVFPQLRYDSVFRAVQSTTAAAIQDDQSTRIVPHSGERLPAASAPQSITGKPRTNSGIAVPRKLANPSSEITTQLDTLDVLFGSLAAQHNLLPFGDEIEGSS